MINWLLVDPVSLCVYSLFLTLSYLHILHSYFIYVWHVTNPMTVRVGTALHVSTA